MAEIFRNDALPDYFSSCDWHDETDMSSLTELYETGRVILLQNRRLDFDADFFAKLRFPAKKEYKKFKAVQIAQQIDSGKNPYPDLVNDCFAGDEGQAAYFAQQVTSIVTQISQMLEVAAPEYTIQKSAMTLRATPTFNENLHVDVYKQDIPTHHLRVFANLDSAHRIWRTSWPLAHLLEHRLAELPGEQLRSLSPGQLLRALNFHVFGGKNSIFEERHEPTHTTYFESGEMWLVDSRLVSHQIFYGRCAISSESVIAESDMLDSSRHYHALAEQHRQRLLQSEVVA